MGCSWWCACILVHSHGLHTLQCVCTGHVSSQSHWHDCHLVTSLPVGASGNVAGCKLRKLNLLTELVGGACKCVCGMHAMIQHIWLMQKIKLQLVSWNYSVVCNVAYNVEASVLYQWSSNKNWGHVPFSGTGRAQLWSSQVPMIFNRMYCSDGFFLNLCSVLLRLCRPFSEPCSPKLLKVQHTYCLATRGQYQQVRNRNIHMKGKCAFYPCLKSMSNKSPYHPLIFCAIVCPLQTFLKKPHSSPPQKTTPSQP